MVKTERPNIGVIVEELEEEIVQELKEKLDPKTYNLSGSVIRKAAREGVCRGIEAGLNMSEDFMPKRFKPDFSVWTK